LKKNNALKIVKEILLYNGILFLMMTKI